MAAHWSFDWSHKKQTQTASADQNNIPDDLPTTGKAISEYLIAQPTPVCAMHIQRHLQADFPKVHKTTIYRNLDTLLGRDLITTVEIGDGQHHYEWKREPHHYFFCEQCRQCHTICESNFRYAMSILTSELRAKQYQVHESKVVFTGCCDQCQ